MNKEIFITGYSVRAPNSDSLYDFYENLNNGVDMRTLSRRYPETYRNLPLFNGTLKTIDKFDNLFFELNQKQTDKMDILIRLLLETTHEALIDSKLSM